MNVETLLALSVAADDDAGICQARGDTEGRFYAMGLRDAYRTAATCFDLTGTATAEGVRYAERGELARIVEVPA